MTDYPKIPLGKMKCPCCGTVAVVMQTKNGGGFLMCQMPLGEGWCATRVQLSRNGVTRMLGKPAAAPIPKAANENRPPVANDDRAPAAPKMKGGDDGSFLGC